MSASELSQNVKYASEVHDDRTLDKAIQRVLDESRVKKDIVEYLKRQPNRFFFSIVVATLHDDQKLNDAFGVLKFDGTQKYYALDGQHRLSAIKTLLDRTEAASDGAPIGFENDEISVIVVPSQGEAEELWQQVEDRKSTMSW